jgi:hypothetical protein
MHPSGWITLVQTVPPEFHDNLSVFLLNGVELSVQAILRMEEQFIVMRGRVMGSTDAGLVYFVPYEQITCLGYSKTVKEEVVQGWFQDGPIYAVTGAPALSLAPRLEPAAPAEGEAEPGVEEPEAAPSAPAAAPVPAPTRPSVPGVPRPAPAAAPRPAAPRPAPAAARPAPPGPMPVAMPLQSGMPLPAKAAMIERLRKKAASSHQGVAKPPPEQK